MSTSAAKNSSENPVVTQALDAIKQYQKEADTGGKKRWIFGLLGIILAVVAGAVVYWKLWKQGKELAKLRHQQDVNIEKEAQARVAAVVESNAEKKAELILHVDEARLAQVILQDKIDILNASAEQNRAVIAGLQSWEEIDSFIKGE